MAWILFIVDRLIGWGIGKTTYEFTLNDQVQVFTSPGVGFLQLAFALAVLIPSLAVAVRRLHDTARTGWWLLWGYLLALVCCVGFIILLVFYLQRGTAGDNKYGADPLAGTAS